MVRVFKYFRHYAWAGASSLCVFALLAREYGGLFDGGGIRFWFNVAVHCVLLACVPVGFLACTSLARDRPHLADTEWWARVGIWKSLLCVYFVLFLYAVFFSSHRR